MWIAVVVPVMKSGEKGGAEALYKGLVKGLRQTAHEVDRIDVAIDESTFEAVLESYETCANLDLHDYDLVISTKAPTYMVRHRNHISYLLHTLRVFYDRFHQEFGRGTLEQFRQRRRIHTLDKTGLHPDRVKRHFAIGHAPYKRLYDVDTFWQQIKFEVLYPAPLLEDFREPRAGEYVFLPGRLHRWKRVDLVIQAFRYVTQDIPLKIAGVGEDEPALRALAAGDRRIEFLGRVSDAQLLDLYAGALVVPFVPVDEDYGFITIEAFKSKKPVITCVDSGEPTYFVKHCESGFIVKPEPEAIAEKINYLIDHPEHAAEMGEKAAAAVPHISWDRVVAKLLAAVEIPQRRVRKWVHSPVVQRPLKVLITDNQCIEPAVGGSRLRLLGLYRTLTEGLEATYVGTYDWRGPGYRELQLSERLREIDVPQSEAHFAINDHLNTLLPGKTIIDVTMPWLVWSSPELVETLRKHAQEADVAIFSHPWMYGCVRDVVRAGGRLIIYDAQNCEAVLRDQLLGSHEFGRCLAQSVREIEGLLCQESDLILACSEEDKQAFVALHGVQAEKIVIVPNGVDIQNIQPVSVAARAQAKDALGIAGFAALFIGIAYPPNLEAARLIIDQLAPANPDVTFIIVGSVGERIAAEIDRSNRPPNVRLLGAVSDAVRNRSYAAADIAINPMLTGSGTNIKMLDFLAAGLPTVTTPIGARGINNRHNACFIVDDIGQFNDWIRTLQADPQLYAKLAVNGRKLAEDLYDWRAISERLGKLILQHAKRRRAGTTHPYFSVVIPSYERPQSLTKLLRLLTRQVFADFEVIVVDQSAAVLDLEALCCNFPIQYLHTSEKGAGKARNLGIAHARGRVVAFTDDDCEPDDCWLANAYKYFRDEEVVGLEGRIESDTTDEERYRIVTNHGLEGLGFMTANLFLRKDVLDQIGGFDERFRSPFREDTDLAWRALSYGKIPFAPDVKVLHPAHRRDMQRESRDARSKFFEYDPLLFQKHPKRYLQLLKTEAHYARAPGFWEHFMRGMLKHKVEIPVEDLRDYTTAAQYSLLGEIAKLLDSGRTNGHGNAEASTGKATELVQDCRALFESSNTGNTGEECTQTVILQGESQTRDQGVNIRPFNFTMKTEKAHNPRSLCQQDRKWGDYKFIVPDWFKKYWHPDEASLKYWQHQYELAKQNQEHRLPEDCMRMPSNELHQLMAKDFWQEVPKDFHTILDVGCSDGYMVKVFKDAGKDAVGINDFLYPTDKLFIDEFNLKVYEMDMHSMDFDDQSFDAVWCRHTLEHSFAPLQVLFEIYRITKDNGYLFAVLPPPPDPPEAYEGHWHQIPQYQFKYLLEMCHFEILSMRTAYFSYQRENDNLEIRAICRKKA
ncbi:MAG TPA: glycosyltransferase [Alphaproteobacteria bacterium]|nr:glycosyltransferase [Alphaproteobacteria bacterium]